MKKKLTSAMGIVAVAVMMVVLQPPEWAGAQGRSPDDHAVKNPLKVCFRYLRGGDLGTFVACVHNEAKDGDGEF